MVPSSSQPTARSNDALRSRSNLPSQLTALIGREQEISAVKTLLCSAETRLLTLSGPAGIGKTRLSSQVAAELVPVFADGVYFVPLAAIRQPHFVVSAIAQCLGLKEAQGQELLKQLQEHVGDRRMLLVLDNFEQVIAATPIVASLLAACPRLTLVITSRTVLRISGEQQFAVPPLALPNLEHLPDLETLSQHAAVAFFIARAQSSDPTFRLTLQNAPVIAEICHRLDGLPLAIELATARLKVLSPQALLERLNSRLSLLTCGARDLPAHQQTLRRTLDWSYELLDAGERAIFCRLGAFVGGCRLEAIEAVCAGSSEQANPLDHLSALLDQSMLLRDQATPASADNEPRFRMLETIREYAVERLAACGELDSARRSHAVYFLSLVEIAEVELIGPKQGYWLARLEEEHDNLRAALQWALERNESEIALRLSAALWRFWHVRGHLSDGRRWLEAVLSQSRAQRTNARARALCGGAWLEHLCGNIEQAKRLFDESLAIARELNDAHNIGLALAGVGRMLHLQGNPNQAMELYEEGLTLFRQLGDEELIAWSLIRLGLLATEQGQLARATELLDESLLHFRNVGYLYGVTWSLIYLGNVLLEQGDYRGAATLFEESLATYSELGDKQIMATSLAHLGRAAFYQGDVAQAVARYQESLALFQDLGAWLGIVECLEVLARAVWAEEQVEQAVQLLAAAAAQRERLGVPLPPGEHARHERMLAAACARLGQPGFAAIWNAGQALSPEQAVSTIAASVAPGGAESSRPAARPPQELLAPLTTRELEVLRLVATGLTDAQVAKILVLSPRTVNAHLRSIYSKLGVASRSAATRFAIEHGLI